MAAHRGGAEDRWGNAEFQQAFGLLEGLVDLAQADQLCPLRHNAVYSTSIVLWMLVYQRMHPDASLEAAVKMLLDSRPACLPMNQRVTKGTLSANTGAYSRARSRLPVELARWLATQVSESLVAQTTPTFAGRRVYLFDGTTITLAPEEELRQRFPPASNQHGEGVWPVALLVVAHELASGAALLPAVGAMYGPEAVSETALLHTLLSQLPADGIVLADAGYGIFRVAWDVAQSERSFVLRLTPQRFHALRKKSTPVDSGSGWSTSTLRWCPSSRERQKHSELPPDAELTVRLHEQVLANGETLYFVTDLPDATPVLSELYRHRGDVEIDIRNVKVVLNTEEIRARSVPMFEKELWTSLVAYNLVIQFRRQAAALANKKPRQLSFTKVWRTFRQFLWTKPPQTAPEWQAQYDLALSYAMKDKLPNRPGRSYPRTAYHRRPKSAQFPKRAPPNSRPDT